MQYESNKKIEQIELLFRKAYKANDNELIEEMRALINSFKHHVEHREAKANSLGNIDELHLIKNEMYLLERESATELRRLYFKGVKKYMKVLDNKED